jgi:hypothetical protein
MNERVQTSTTLLEWLQQPPTVVIYRPDGQLSLDQLPDMDSPKAVVCFKTMKEAKQFLKHVRQRKRYRAVNLAVAKWLEAIRAEAEKGRTHLSIWNMPGDETVGKRSVRIEDVLRGFEFATKATQEMQPWRWN